MVSFSKEIPIKYDVDFCVAGGGPAGLCAAISAARQGLSVYLAESHGFFGGAATAAMIPAFMPFHNGADFLSGGLGREIYDRCLEAGFHLYPSGVLSIAAEPYKKILDDMVRAEPNITFSFFTNLIDVLADNGEVSQCIFGAKSGLFAVNAKVFADCTGDGDLCAWAGASYELGGGPEPLMPATLCSLWAGINWEDKDFPENEKLEDAIQDGVFTQHDRHLTGLFMCGPGVGGGNIGHSYDVDATDEISLTKGMLCSRDILPEYEIYYRDYLKRGYKDAHIAVTAPYLGIRESRRIIGDYIMTVDDYIKRARFDDEIGVFSYPIDIHPTNTSKERYKEFENEFVNLRYEKGEFYGIPYRVLIPRSLKNVYVVGRCASFDRKMQSSARTMPCCFIMGQAIGAGAGLAVKSGTSIRDVNIQKLRAVLKDMKAFLP